jgi:CheY-like chemotaxis protein
MVPLQKVRPASGGDCRPVILVVDDESAIADTLTQILCLNGYRAMAAYDGAEALESALLTPPALLITDVVMPGMNGIDLAITIRRIFPDCKILLFSGQAATMDLLANARNAGHPLSFTLLTKPVHPNELLSYISATFKPQEARAGSAVG